ncbi:MAG: HAD-IIIA family hydrolase [Phycisphaerales bacterium]
MPRPAIFLDRDDTLIENATLPPEAFAARHHGDLCDPAWVRPLPNAINACRRLAGAGFALIVVSNQGLVARGHGTIEQVEATNDAMRRLFTDDQHRGLIAAIYYCPFHPIGRVPAFTREHPWRKPAPGMLMAAAAALDIDLARSWAVGDKPRDLESGRRAGIPDSNLLLVSAAFDLAAAADRILAASQSR